MAVRKDTRLCRGTVAAGLTLALGVAGLFPARAEAAILDELQSRIDSCTEAYNTAVDQAIELQNQIGADEQRISQIEDELPTKRDAASASIRIMYKLRQSTSGVIDLLLSASDFNDVITTVQYLDHVVTRNNEAISDLTRATSELEQTRNALASEKRRADEQVSSAMASLEQANSAREQYEAEAAAQKAAAEAAAKAEAEAAAKAQQEARAKAEAEAEVVASAATSAESAQTTSESAATQQDPTSSSSTATGSGSASDTSSSTTSGSASSSSSSDVKDEGEWMSGLASAYGIDNNTGSTATASGIPLTSDSMTVAVPVSQSYLLGSTVEIRYGGKTVAATVTDTGGFASYGRVLDLAGGVWKAFGFSSDSDWGVRAVSYRFL
ncbi:hypothetical protein [Paratractidigestivibacter sp.]|uniref:coiled-coil domain-containing protein n=1 Tax=Paratractidigestivibacter sp. TaxID=2847316 RepID=UPI002ACB190F|nr:hypothetical protein [Paratractidigestivibacter sp.]